ncbi:MAG TPA: WecB/TagA/CpsF family glycosyltransferase [Xanthobacteraceae bacterium]|nr:WecB/TagA/CpsF family glycosyltransferase [Xanthobacteraceae bacterium]
MPPTAIMRRTPAGAGSAPPLVPGCDDDARAADAAHVAFLGMPFALWTQTEVIEAIIAHHGAPYRYVVTPNAAHVVAVHNEPGRLLPIYRSAWLSLCDSRIVRALARLDRLALPLVTGSDLVAALLATLNAQERPGAPRPILVVGPPHGTEAALRARYPNLTFDVLPAPADLARSAEARLAVARACLSRDWQLALLCLGSPAQEMIAATLAELGHQSGVALCVGASIDFLTGARARAPRWLQRLSLEWAYRLACEPRRLWRRYLVESPRILRIFIVSRSRRAR